METSKDFAWVKYEKRLNELENRLKRGSCGKGLSSPAVFIAVHSDHDEEIKFVKAELEQLKDAKEVAAKLKTDIENLMNFKDAEISKLYAKYKEIEDENNVLKNKVNRHNFNAGQEAHLKRHNSRKYYENKGIFSWLQKSLVVIGSK